MASNAKPPDSARLDYRRPRGGRPVSVLVGSDGGVRGIGTAVGGAYQTVGRRSPDGEHVATLLWGSPHDRLVVSRSDRSSGKRLGHIDGEVPTWSPDSRRLYYEWQRGMRVLEIDTGHDRRLVRVGGAGFICLAVSADGDHLAFLRRKKLNPGFLSDYDEQLFVMNADGTDMHAVSLNG